MFWGIRFAAAIIIIIFHYNKLTGGVHDDPNLPLYSILRPLYVHGGKLVELFFMMSGFCFMLFSAKKIEDRETSFKRFLMHRLCRIMPSYWLSSLLVLLLTKLSILILETTINGTGGNPQKPIAVILNVFCMDFVNPINGVTWFLAVNLICYICYYYLLRLPTTRKIKGLFWMSCVALSSVEIIILGYSHPLSNLARGLASFGSGVMAIFNNQIVENDRRKVEIVRVSFVCLVGISIGLVLLDFLQELQWIFEVYILYPSFLLIITNIKKVRNVLSKSPLQKLGKYSFSIYIFQTAGMCICYFVYEIIGVNDWYMTFSFITSIIFVIVFGIVMYFIFEQPINRILKKWEEKANEKDQTVFDC